MTFVCPIFKMLILKKKKKYYWTVITHCFSITLSNNAIMKWLKWILIAASNSLNIWKSGFSFAFVAFTWQTDKCTRLCQNKSDPFKFKKWMNKWIFSSVYLNFETMLQQIWDKGSCFVMTLNSFIIS